MASEDKKSKREHIIHFEDTPSKSLDEVNGSVEVPHNAGFWKTLAAYTGPGILVAVGYMDPGNWITSIAGGASFKYSLLSVILISSLIAMLLQAMAARLGIVTGRDLAQMTRDHTNKAMGGFLWVITELAIMATDIAEIIGSAIALKLLFNMPLIVGIIITTADVLILLLLMRLGFRKIEAVVATLVLVILLVFAYEVILAHDLFLGSSISQTRKIDRTKHEEVKKAIKFSTIDSNLQLTMAFIVNSLLLILGAALFFGTSSSVGRFVDLFNALSNSQIVGAIASPMLSMLFAVALLASGQSSTITGTLAGQIIMEGFIHLKMPLWAQRLLTRLMSVTPVLIFAIYYHGNEAKIENLLTFSQVFLSIALPFAVIPLVLYTSDKKIMGEFANRAWVKWTAWFISGVLIILNLYLIAQTLGFVK